MKSLIILSFLCCIGVANAKNIYISAAGNDADNGLTQSTPWKTIAKLNASFAGIAAGDSILFKRGDIFYGAIVIGKSGTVSNPIVVGAYGTGAKPLISGFTPATGWANVGGNLWESTVISNAKKTNMVVINGADIPMGRYPNTGYLTFESSVGNSAITDNELSGTPNWTGGEIVIRKYHWYMSRDVITNHAGTNITYAGTSPYNSTNGYGYFIQNSLATLDTLNEWFFNKVTKRLTVYSIGAPANVQMATVDTLLYIGPHDDITVENISFEGSNVDGINGSSLTNQAFRNVIKNCDVNFSGGNGIYYTRAANCIVQNCSIQNSHNAGIVFNSTGGHSDNIIIDNNYVNKSGMVPGGGYNDGSSNYAYHGIIVKGQNALIQYNTVDATGYNGIDYYYDNSKVKYNRVNNFCSLLDDGAGIYTWAGAGVINTGREVIGNIVTNGIGAPTGTNDKAISAFGIYADDGSSGITIDSNAVSNMAHSGIYVHNANNLKVRSNKVYNGQRSQLLMVEDPGTLNIRNIILQTNQLVATNPLAYVVNISSGKNDVDSFGLNPGSFNNNYYCRPLDENVTIHTTKIVSGNLVGNDYTLNSWKIAYPKYDNNSHISPLKLPAYQINSYKTSNLVTNGLFVSNINGILAWSPTSNITATWDNTSKINSTGSLKIVPKVASDNFTIVYSIAGTGASSSGKKYILRVTTLGTKPNGVLRAYLRQNTAPFTTLTSIQTSDIGVTKKVHEFLISDAANNTNTSFVFDVKESSGTTYLDDIELFEVDASTINIDNYIRFEYNATKSAKTIALDAKYISIDSVEHNGTITLQPYNAAILLKSGIVTVGLKADAGSDISLVLPVNTAVLKGSAVGTVTNYTWTKIAGPAQFTIASPNSPSTTISNLTMGKYTFELKVTNSIGESSTATVNVVALGVLPVTLIDFTASRKESDVQLQWNVSSELNFSHYSVERSSTGVGFESIGIVNATNIFISQRYNYTDNLPLLGTSYYRLAMVDKDGTTKYSKVLSLTDNESSSFELTTVVLSRTNSSIKIAVQSNYDQVMQVVIADVSGRIIYSNPIQLKKGFNELNRKIPALHTGVYYAKMFTADVVITKAILSQH